MACYFRHLKEVFEAAGIEVSSVNKKQIDRTIHDIAGVSYKNCSATWRKLKQEMLSDEQKRRHFVARLRSAVRGMP